MSDEDLHYQIRRKQVLMHHFPADSAILQDSVDDPHHEITVRVRSGQYFASLAMQLENLCDDPYIDPETFKYILRKFAEELLYLQDAYIIRFKH